MEKVFKVPSDDLVSIQDELDTFKSELKLHDDQPLPTNDDDIMKLLDIDDMDTFAKLKDSVDIDKHLSQPDDVRVLPFSEYKPRTQLRQPIVEIPRKILHLNTFREIVKFKKKYYGNPLGSSLFNYRYQEEPPKDFPDLKPHEDFLMSVRFYRPYSSALVGRAGKPRFAEEFIVRGQQYLSELRDKVSCQCTRPLYEISTDPDQVFPPLEADPGFFFITDTFYNDTRNPKNPDYSEVILKWAETRPKGTFTAQFKTAKMETTKFVDLKFRLGFPQVYQHYGNCEHLFTFSWIRLIDSADSLSSRYYPMLRSMDLANKQQCGICGLREHVFVVLDSDRHMHNPVYLCRICFNSYHYADGKKIGVFKAYCVNPEPDKQVYGWSSSDDEGSDGLEVGRTELGVASSE